MLAEASRKEDGRRGPELVFYGAPWSLRGNYIHPRFEGCLSPISLYTLLFKFLEKGKGPGLGVFVYMYD